MNDDRDHRQADGPWRVGPALCVCVTGSPADAGAELVRGLDDVGLPVSRTILIGADRPQPSRIPGQGVKFETAQDLRQVLDEAASRAEDILVVDACIDLDPAAALEMREVAATDPMIFGVSPRFDRMAMAAFPDRNPNPPCDAAAAVLRAVFPRVTYAPLPDPRCLYVKGSVLAEFRPDRERPFDWDARALAANSHGFRTVLANHALARLRPGGGHDAGSPGARAARLESAFPGTRAAVAAFTSAAARSAEEVLAALVPDAAGKRTVAFDLTHIGEKRFGTAEVALALIRRAIPAWAGDWVVGVIASPTTHAFHFAADTRPPVRIDPADPMVCAAYIRVGQPFSWKDLDEAVRRAPAIVFFMLDTIGLDCMRLAPDELDALWRFTLREADGLLFNSGFTERQFARRFSFRSGQPRCASLHSLSRREYAMGRTDGESDGTILVIGNGFPHKRVEATARLLVQACPGRRIAALGLASGVVDGIEGYPSGTLDDATMAGLYGRAAVVVYPSLYEGFGFPLIEALAYRKPVLIRPLAPFAEILAGIPEAANVHIFNTDAELVTLARADLRWTEVAAAVPATRCWDDSLADMRRILDEAVRAVNYDRIVRRIEFMRGRLEWIRQKPFRDDPSLGENLDRAAALAGRIARHAVLRLAGLPGGRTLFRLAGRAARRRRSP